MADSDRANSSRDDAAFDFAETVRAARSGDPAAVSRLVEQARPYLLMIANQDLDREIQAKLGASDIVQQTMIAACEKIHQFRGNTQDAFHGWVRQILRNDLLNARRHYRQTQQRDAGREHRLNDSRLTQPQIVDRNNTPETDALAQEEQRMLQQAMAQLPDNYRRVLRMRNWEDLSFVEIGGRLGLSADAARKIWTRAVSRLTELMDASQSAQQDPAGAGDGVD